MYPALINLGKRTRAKIKRIFDRPTQVIMRSRRQDPEQQLNTGLGNGSSTDPGNASLRIRSPSTRAREHIYDSLQSFKKDLLPLDPCQGDGNFLRSCRDFARTDLEEAATLLKNGVNRDRFLSLASVMDVVRKAIDVFRRPVELIKEFTEHTSTKELIREWTNSADDVEKFCTGLEMCIDQELANKTASLNEIYSQMKKARSAWRSSDRKELQELLQNFWEKRNEFMSVTLLDKLDALIRVFQSHKDKVEACSQRMQRSKTFAEVAKGVSNGLKVCFTVASFICTVLATTLVSPLLTPLTIGIGMGAGGAQALVELAEGFRKQLRSKAGLVEQLKDGTTIAIDELDHLKDKIQEIKDQLVEDENATPYDPRKLSSLFEYLKSYLANIESKLDYCKTMATECKAKLKIKSGTLNDLMFKSKKGQEA